MIIVVEGCDNSGKTTIALKLAKRLKGLYLKSENIPPKREYLAQYMGLLAVAELYGNGIVVSDRHHAVSEPIYGSIIRGGHQLEEIAIQLALTQISAFVYCRPSDELIIGKMPEREQMPGVLRNARKLIEAYDQYFESTYLDFQHKVWTYDYTKNSDEALALEILRYTEPKQLTKG